MKKFYLILSVFIFLSGSAYGDIYKSYRGVGRTPFFHLQSEYRDIYKSYPKSYPGVRAKGMGGAFVSVASDASALWYNPAGLVNDSGDSVDLTIEQLDITSLIDDDDFEDYPGDTTFVGGSINLDSFAWGLAYYEPYSEFLQMVSLGMAWRRSLGNDFDFKLGGTIEYLIGGTKAEEMSYNSDLTGFSFSAGCLLEKKIRAYGMKFAVGAVYRGDGELEDKDYDETVIDNAKPENIAYGASFSKSLGKGIILFSGEKETTTYETASGEYESDKTSYGIEYQYIPLKMAIRIGRYTDEGTSLLNKKTALTYGYSWGFYKALSLDIAYEVIDFEFSPVNPTYRFEDKSINLFSVGCSLKF